MPLGGQSEDRNGGVVRPHAAAVVAQGIERPAGLRQRPQPVPAVQVAGWASLLAASADSSLVRRPVPSTWPCSKWRRPRPLACVERDRRVGSVRVTEPVRPPEAFAQPCGQLAPVVRDTQPERVEDVGPLDGGGVGIAWTSHSASGASANRPSAQRTPRPSPPALVGKSVVRRTDGTAATRRRRRHRTRRSSAGPPGDGAAVPPPRPRACPHAMRRAAGVPRAQSRRSCRSTPAG